jgi:hypothetical protein
MGLQQTDTRVVASRIGGQGEITAQAIYQIKSGCVRNPCKRTCERLIKAEAGDRALQTAATHLGLRRREESIHGREEETKLRKLRGRVTTVAEFLDLSEAEQAVKLAAAMRKKRTAVRVRQAALAKAVGSSQARATKLEGGDPHSREKIVCFCSRRILYPSDPSQHPSD